MPENSFRLPDDTQHIAIIGKNGTGKTLAGLFHLSKRNFETYPWVIVNFKRDEHIRAITKARYLELGEAPKTPGIFVVEPNASDPEPLADTLAAIYEQENCGVWFDEALFLQRSKKVEARFIDLLTQGRSKHIPVITLVQRPSWITRFVFSESSFFQLFHLQDARDVATVSEVVQNSNAFCRLPAYHSSYYDVGNDTLTFLAPVPSEDEILADIDRRLPRKKFLR